MAFGDCVDDPSRGLLGLAEKPKSAVIRNCLSAKKENLPMRFPVLLLLLASVIGQAAPPAPASRSLLSLGPDSRVLLFNTEGATDPELYARLVADAA